MESNVIKRIKHVKQVKNANYECTCVECGTKFQSNRKTAMYCCDYCRVHSHHKRSNNERLMQVITTYFCNLEEVINDTQFDVLSMLSGDNNISELVEQSLILYKSLSASERQRVNAARKQYFDTFLKSTSFLDNEYNLDELYDDITKNKKNEKSIKKTKNL